MKRLALLISVFLVWSTSSHGQNSPVWRLDSLPQADQLIVDEEGNIILLDTEQARIFRFLKAYNYDSLVFIGGRSNRQEGLVHPVTMSLQNRQSLFVLDDAVGRLLVLNPNLRIVQTQEYMGQGSGGFGEKGESLFPVDFAVGPLGEQFLINRIDNRVVKINSFGEEELRFAGPDFGPGALYQPVEVGIDDENYVYVSDTSRQLIKVYDLYGVFRFSLELAPGFSWEKFRIYRPWLICFREDAASIMNLARQEWVNLPFDWPETISDVFLRGSTLYILTGTSVIAYSLE